VAKTYDPKKYADPIDAFFEAANDLGIKPANARGHLSQITNYLNANGFPGWEANDARAGDYVGYKGNGWNWGWDVLPTGDKDWIRLNDVEHLGTAASRGKGSTAATGGVPGTPAPTNPGDVTAPVFNAGEGPPAPPDAGGSNATGGGDQAPGTVPVGAPGGSAGPAGIPGVPSDAEMYGAAYAAMMKRRNKAAGGGRQGTILGGFGSGNPQTRSATLLGY